MTASQPTWERECSADALAGTSLSHMEPGQEETQKARKNTADDWPEQNPKMTTATQGLQAESKVAHGGNLLLYGSCFLTCLGRLGLLTLDSLGLVPLAASGNGMEMVPDAFRSVLLECASECCRAERSQVDFHMTCKYKR